MFVKENPDRKKKSNGSSVFRTSSSSQASQDESVVCDFVKSEGERMR